ncbi:secreted protein [Amycolatopsis sulphurea]|uniref:Secreted protein n=1 Tax=Amycolatopsis sulphurea TaxID=76022 RepID=A0A2A9F6S1_9PSEU|nr:twin-arginine translocation signal domain-containing protein [Amycolatopsis sulphurea]PFG46461.1 secreted protein [Amycolatopsis sulphurea]
MSGVSRRSFLGGAAAAGVAAASTVFAGPAEAAAGRG